MCDCSESFKVGDGEHGVSERLGEDEFGSVVNKGFDMLKIVHIAET